MKLKLFFAAVALIVSSVTFAQPQRQAPSAEDIAKLKTEKMTKELQLTDEQSAKLFKVNLKQAKQQQKQWAKTRKQYGSYNDALEDILTDEQMENYKKNHAKHVGERGQAPRKWGKRDGAPHNWDKPDGNRPPIGEKMEPIRKKPGHEGVGKRDGQYME